MKRNTVKINGSEYKVKNTLRALFIFEQIAEKPFEVKTVLDNYVFFYSVLLANNPDNPLDWDEFIDALDDDPSLTEKMNTILAESSRLDRIMGSNAGKDGKAQKKS